LAPHPTENKENTFVVLCNITIRCCKADIVCHSQRVKYVTNVNFQNQSFDNIYNILHTDKVKLAEVKLAVFFAEHNIVFYIANQSIPLLKNIKQ